MKYYVKNEKGEQVEVAESEGEGEREKGGLVGKLFRKLKRTSGGKRSDMRYTAANTEDTTVDHE